jgi:hypothetical protein
MSFPPRVPPTRLTQAERIAMMAAYDALPTRDLRMFVAFGPGFCEERHIRDIQNALRGKGMPIDQIKGFLRQGWRGLPGAEAHWWKRDGHRMPYPHIGANATIMYTEPFDTPKNARERLAARRRVARLRMPAPNPIREVKHTAPDVILL